MRCIPTLGWRAGGNLTGRLGHFDATFLSRRCKVTYNWNSVLIRPYKTCVLMIQATAIRTLVDVEQMSDQLGIVVEGLVALIALVVVNA